MDQLQAKLYKLLVEIDGICKENGVVYYLAGGTALGAIRGGGFLPWDDDIDLYITRENWNKLVKVMETKTPPNRSFICDENTDYYWNPVGRYVDKNTTVMMKSQLLCGKACGQLIEFFIMDPMPMSEEGKWEHRRYLKAYTELLSPYFVVNRNILHQNTDFDYKLYNKYYWKSIFLGRNKVLGELLDKVTATPEEESDCYCMRWGMRTLMYGKDLLGTPRMERFENDMFPVPAKQEAVARVAYGDSWMYVPEGTGKVVHNLNKDLMTPFQQYVDLYMPLLDRKKLLKSYQKNKRMRVKALYDKNQLFRAFASVRIKLAAKYIRTHDYDIPQLRSLLDNRELDELQKHLEYFYSEQLNPDVKADGLLLPLSDEYLYIAIMNCILQGRYYQASSILSSRREKPEPLGEELQYAAELMEFCRALSIAIYDEKDAAKTERLLRARPEYAEVLIDYARAELWCLAQKADGTEDYERLIQRARSWMERFGADGELLRYEAYGLYRLGQVEEARAGYEAAIRGTRNGYVWKEASDLFGMDAYDLVDNPEKDEDEEIEEAGPDDDDETE